MAITPRNDNVIPLFLNITNAMDIEGEGCNVRLDECLAERVRSQRLKLVVRQLSRR